MTMTGRALRPESPLILAIQLGDWQRVSWYILLGVSLAAEKLPPESLVAILEMLGGEAEDDARR